MHIRTILFSIVFLTTATGVSAQQNRSNSYMRVSHVDSIVSCPNIDTHAVAMIRQLELQPFIIKAVPLAGNKTYFGKQNDFMNQFVRQYLSSRAKTLAVVQTRARQHFSLMENILKKNNLPRELIYLSVIESALNNKAISPVGAVGPWQLMAGTAELMGITVSGKRDDRTDWYKSTNAAAKYLKYLYQQFGDWLLVVAAYNSGPVPVHRAIAITGSTNFWDIKKYLPRETQGHVLAFVATASIFEHMSTYIASGRLPDDFKFSPEDVTVAATPPKPKFTPEELKRMAIIQIKDPISIDVLVQNLSMNRKELEHWNDDYEMFLLAGNDDGVYQLRIPKDKVDDFVAQKETIIRLSKAQFDSFSM